MTFFCQTKTTNFMNNNAMTKKSTIKAKTNTGKLPDSFGFPRGGGGVIRQLTKKELAIQAKYTGQ